MNCVKSKKSKSAIGINKVKIRVLLEKLGCRLSGVMYINNTFVVYGYCERSHLWGFWRYLENRGFGQLVPLELNLTKEDALFKRDVLLANF